MKRQVHTIFIIGLLNLESGLIDIRFWFLRRIERLLKRQIILLEAIKVYAESRDRGA